MTKIKVEGAHGVSATILADSVSPSDELNPEGVRLLSMEITYWRGILAEFNTHGMLCKNSASSRAIPFAKMQNNLTGRPHRFGQANPGMQDKGTDHTAPIGSGYNPEQWWHLAGLSAKKFSEGYHEAGYAKQIFNRLTETFQMMKTVVTFTEGNNFFWLRDHGAADPSIAELARVMKEAKDRSTPQVLFPGEWHLPYVDVDRPGPDGEISYSITDVEVYDIEPGVTGTNVTITPLTQQEALAVSSARCAAVSFRNVDYGVEKSKEVAAKLIGDDRKHGSAFQHQATPMKAEINPDRGYGVNIPSMPRTWEPGISHADRDGQLWSAQFRGWIMQRKLIPGENVPG